MRKSVKTRNNAVDILKFGFSIIIMMYHFYGATLEHFPMGGSIGIQIFVMISAVFSFHKMEAWSSDLTTNFRSIHWLKARYIRFFPYVFWGFILAVFVNRYVPVILGENTLNFAKFIKWLASDIWEPLLININGMRNNNGNTAFINGPMWMISALIAVEFFVSYFYFNHKKILIDFLLPLVIFLGYGYWGHSSGGPYNKPFGPISFGFLLVLLPFCLGYYSCVLSKRLKALCFTDYGFAMMAALEILLYAAIVSMIIFLPYSLYYIWLATLLAIPAIAITISGQGVSRKLGKLNLICNALGELSMGVYLVHFPIYKLFLRIYPDNYERYSHKFSFVLIVLVVSVLYIFLVKYSKKATKKLSVTIKKLIVE